MKTIPHGWRNALLVVLLLWLSVAFFMAALEHCHRHAPALVVLILREARHTMEVAFHILATVTLAVLLLPWNRVSICGFMVWTGLLLIGVGCVPLAAVGAREAIFLFGWCVAGIAHLIWVRHELVRALRVALNAKSRK